MTHCGVKVSDMIDIYLCVFITVNWNEQPYSTVNHGISGQAFFYLKKLQSHNINDAEAGSLQWRGGYC
jgi:hypothetical protein